jgi:hypothetical protein
MPKTGQISAYTLALCSALITARARAESPELAFAKAADARLKQEATDLFRIILVGPLSTPQPCQFGAKWLKGTEAQITEDIARRYLNLKVHADLSAPGHNISYQAVPDPDNKHPDWFCDDEQTQKYEDKKMEEFTKSKNYSMNFYGINLSFPIFNNNYDRAVIIISSSNHYVIKSEKRQQTPGCPASAFAYTKIAGVWREMDSTEISVC